jgi:hypothetical protein
MSVVYLHFLVVALLIKQEVVFCTVQTLMPTAVLLSLTAIYLKFDMELVMYCLSDSLPFPFERI